MISPTLKFGFTPPAALVTINVLIPKDASTRIGRVDLKQKNKLVKKVCLRLEVRILRSIATYISTTFLE